MSVDNIEYGQRVSCNGVNGTVIDKRSTRNQRLVLVKMDNGFTLKLSADMLSVRSSETSQTSRPSETSRTLHQML